jgi:DNA-directed RNA polymerase specialized sigma24 family protein
MDNFLIQHDDLVCSKIDTEKFYLNLKPFEREILELRIKGYTYQEIAEKAGYKTHSAVLKRINRIAEQYLDYTDENEKFKSLSD